MTIRELEQRVEEIRSSHQEQIIKLENQIFNLRKKIMIIEDDLANHGIGSQEKE